MPQTIRMYEKNVYGNVLTYVFDENQAMALRKLTRRASITDADIEALKDLGFKVEIERMPAHAHTRHP